MSTTATTTTTKATMESHIEEGYATAEMLAMTLYAQLSEKGVSPKATVKEIFKFAFETGLMVGHESGHMCAELEAAVESGYTPSGYL